MSFNIEWTNADALTPSPFTVTKDGCHFEVKVDAHYVSDEEVETVRRYIDSLHRENAKLRELVEDMAAEMRGLGVDFKRVGWCDYADRMRELGVEVDE